MERRINLEWHTLSFQQLDTHTLYSLLKLRVDVFVVEQNCPYPELDDKDHHTEVRHLIGKINDEIAAYCRLLPAGVSYPSPSIGRVIIAEKYREFKLGHRLLERAINAIGQLWPQCNTIEIGAQQHLEAYYQKHGFKRCSEMYLEDGIPHIDMVRHQR